MDISRGSVATQLRLRHPVKVWCDV